MRMTTTDAIRYLLLNRPSIPTGEIEVRLAELRFPVPTTFCVSQIRISFLRTLRFLQAAGVIEPDVTVPLPPELKLRRKRKL